MKKTILLAIFCVLASLAGNAAGQFDPGLVDDSFEDPSSYHVLGDYGVGYWKGDPATIVTAQDGITPIDGDRMLQFLNIGHGSSNDIWQLVDMTPFSSLLSSGDIVGTLSAKFNRVAGDAQTDTAFRVSIQAYSGQPTNFPTGMLAEGKQYIYSDSNIGTWELATADLQLPAKTTFIAVGLRIKSDISDDLEFDGHYADAVSLTVTPEPATLSLLAIGGLALLRRKKQFSAKGAKQ